LPKSFAIRRNCSKADDFLGDDVGIGKIGGVFEGIIFESEDVEVGFVAGDEFVVVVGAPAAIGLLLGPDGFTLVAVRRVVAFHEFVEVFSFERIRLEREVLVGPQVVNPELLSPWCFTGRLFVEEEDVSFHALGIKETGRQTQKRVYVAVMQQLAADRLPYSAFKEHIVRHNDGSAAIDRENRLHMLNEV
jgi:hypothetical protein